jgi:hypothetical protein
MLSRLYSPFKMYISLRSRCEAFVQIVAYEKGEELRLANPEVRARR